MPILMFGKWTSKSGKLFKLNRVYWNGWKPLPIVLVHFRYVM